MSTNRTEIDAWAPCLHDSRSDFRVQGLGIRVLSFWLIEQGVEFGEQSLGFRVQRAGCRVADVSDFGFRCGFGFQHGFGDQNIFGLECMVQGLNRANTKFQWG